jgi:hypothetical protein
MMNSWLMLDRMAASRGDGLNPTFRDLLDERDRIAVADDNVIDLASTRGDAHTQAGPMPTPEIRGELPENVVRFPDRAR